MLNYIVPLKELKDVLLAFRVDNYLIEMPDEVYENRFSRQMVIGTDLETNQLVYENYTYTGQEVLDSYFDGSLGLDPTGILRSYYRWVNTLDSNANTTHQAVMDESQYSIYLHLKYYVTTGKYL